MEMQAFAGGNFGHFTEISSRHELARIVMDIYNFKDNACPRGRFDEG
jgi:hypothetical protein